MSDVILYGRPGCHLCADALTVVQRVRAEQTFALEIVDIDGDETLLMRYLERIPVVVVDGEELSAFFLDETEFRHAVGNLSRPANGPQNPT